MLQAHSFLWNYLWVGPNVLLLVLGCLIWRRGVASKFPAFCAFVILSATGHLALYMADIAPGISAAVFWRVDWASVLIESLLKFAVVAEIFTHVYGSYTSLVRLGRTLIRVAGTVLVLTSALVAAYAPPDGKFGIISGVHLLEQTTGLIVTGVLAFIFIFSAYFQLRLNLSELGIALGVTLSACVALATSAIDTNGLLPNQKRIILDFVDMGTFHISVLIWFYYLLLPHKVATKQPVPLPENNLAVWNRELERLLQQ